jgi:hypothetical protein
MRIASKGEVKLLNLTSWVTEEAVDNLVDKLTAPWHVFKFTQGLLFRYNRCWREYADLLDFENPTSKEITRRLTSNERMLRNAVSSRGQGNGSGSGGSGGSSSGSHRNTGEKSAEHRVGSSLPQSFKTKKPTTKLSRATLKSLEDMVKRGGGEKVSKDVEASAEWRKLTKDKELCYKCSAKGHFDKDCRVSCTFRGG